MYTWTSIAIGIMVLIGSTASMNRAAEPASPTQAVRTLVQTIGSIKSSKNGNLSPADTAHNADVAQRVNGMLDIPEVSQRILGRYWKDLTPKDKQAFTDLLSELFVNVAYPKSAKFFADLQIDVTAEQIEGDKAEVKTTVSDPKEGLIAVDYRLQQDDGGWHVQDIILDDVSLVRNLRSQCQQVIAEHSFDELLRRMRDKLHENL